MSSVEKSPSPLLYSNTKEKNHYENYFDELSCNLRIFLGRIRISSHSLGIQTDTFNRNIIHRNERISSLCNNGEIEDEFHFIRKCPQYDSIQKKVFNPFPNNNFWTLPN